jgi:hypothetical protein
MPISDGKPGAQIVTDCEEFHTSDAARTLARLRTT